MTRRGIRTVHEWAPGGFPGFGAPMEFICHVYLAAFGVCQLIYGKDEDSAGLMHGSGSLVIHG